MKTVKKKSSKDLHTQYMAARCVEQCDKYIAQLDEVQEHNFDVGILFEKSYFSECGSGYSRYMMDSRIIGKLDHDEWVALCGILRTAILRRKELFENGLWVDLGKDWS